MSSTKIKISVRDMVFTALFAAILCAVAPIAFPIGPVPITLATLIICTTAGALDWKFCALPVVLYVLLGAVGAPVFSNFEGGFHKIAGVTGGFIIGYIPLALSVGLAVKVFRRKAWSYPVGMVIGTVLLYTCGTAWFMMQTRLSLLESLALCVTPFLLGDTIKIVLATVAAPQLRKAIEHFNRN